VRGWRSPFNLMGARCNVCPGGADRSFISGANSHSVTFALSPVVADAIEPDAQQGLTDIGHSSENSVFRGELRAMLVRCGKVIVGSSGSTNSRRLHVEAGFGSA
jgi:hypothetical protein